MRFFLWFPLRNLGLEFLDSLLAYINLCCQGCYCGCKLPSFAFPVKNNKASDKEMREGKNFSLVTSASLVTVREFFRRKSSTFGFLRAKFHEVLQTDCVLCYPFAGEGHSFTLTTLYSLHFLVYLKYVSSNKWGEKLILSQNLDDTLTSSSFSKAMLM